MNLKDISELDNLHDKKEDAESLKSKKFFLNRIREKKGTFKKLIDRKNVSKMLKEDLMYNLNNPYPTIRHEDLFYIIEEISLLRDEIEKMKN